YAKVRRGATGTKTVLAHLSGLPNPLARALVWSMLWNAVRDAKLKVQDYLDAVALHGPKETEPAILTTV
ncbi:membrane alanyl aminopeptidase, partial [Cutibacterium avidum TM16]|uniref:membrane alanyl aminopeptidase n=1 Tax=Cutibacterium avidum TaxID=33010 RepID=UPI000390B33C